MDTKIGIDMKILCFVCILQMEAPVLSMTCCFEMMGNGSVSYHLSEPAGKTCTPTWEQNDTVLMDELGNTDESRVVYVSTQKLILKQNMEGNVKQVTYRKDCLSTGLAYNVGCQDPCVALDASTTTPALYIGTTQAPGRDVIIYIVFGIIAIIIIAIIIIAANIIICRRRKMCQTSYDTSGLFWKAVPKDETSNSTVLEIEDT